MKTHDHPRNDLALAEAALFLAAQPLTRRGLAKILGGVAQVYVDQLLADLKEQFDDPNRGIELHIEDGRAQFRVKSAYVNEVSHLAPQHDIPRQELRTLAVIAYNHPMTQANLIKVRGNKGYGHVQALIERNLITSEPHGRTSLLRVTLDFLRHFGLNSVDEFRFHFPTAAEENAEALARGGPSGEDENAPDNMNSEAGADRDPSPQSLTAHLMSQEPIDHLESVDRNDEGTASDTENEDANELEPEPLAGADTRESEPSNESDDSRVSLASDSEFAPTENENEDEPDEERSEEVEHG